MEQCRGTQDGDTPRTLREKVARMMRYVASTMFEEACTSIPLRPSLPILVKNQS